MGVEYGPAWLFTLGWALVFAGLVFCLPKVPRWFVRCVPLVTFVTIAVTHSGFMSMFRRFFSFSVLTYGGTGSFMQASYIHIALKVVAGATVTVLLMMTSGRLLKVIPPKPVKLSVILGLVAAVLGAGIIAFTNYHFFPVVDTVVWDNAEEHGERRLPCVQRHHQLPEALRPVPVHHAGSRPPDLPRQHHERRRAAAGGGLYRRL